MTVLEEALNERRISGLTTEEAVRRASQGQSNKLPLESSRSFARILFENAFTPIHSVLFVIAIVLVGLGLAGDAVMTAGLVVVNVVVGVFQEGRAKRQLDRIALLTRPQATVIRDGTHQTISPDDIVLGDLLALQPGDQIQVDGKVIDAESLTVDEALLTGESDQVRKRPGDEVYSGTFCMGGTGIYEAEHVGRGSVAQEITHSARAFRTVRTPLQREVAVVIWSMAIAVSVLSVAVVFSFHSQYGGLPLRESVRAAAVIVALIPQGLAFMVTVTYAMAALRMAKAGALVQRLNAVESMSHIDVLCVDKTGTLTTNQLILENVVPVGVEEAELRRLLGRYARSASVTNKTNDAIADACPGEEGRTVLEVPFDSVRKWSAIAFDDAAARGVYVLGAPEIIQPSLDNWPAVGDEAEKIAETGLRVLLFAHGDGVPLEALSRAEPELPAGLHAIGLVVLRDQLREDASEAVNGFVQGGIALKIISGDNPQTVAALARQAGFGTDLKVRSGADLEGRSDAELEEIVEDTTVFGRIAPQHKEALVRALQRRGHYVAMTGDGVNDVPALKKSQVAVAMRSGSAVTRSVADIVLLSDSFAALPAAFQEGQRIRKGMEAIVRLFLVRTLAVTFLILAAAVLADPFPTTPSHSAVTAQLTVGAPALLIAIWAKPGKSKRYLLPAAVYFVIPAAITIGIAGLVAFELYLGVDSDGQTARTVMIVTSLFCGLALFPLVQLPYWEWTSPRAIVRDKRPLIAVAGLLVIFFAFYSVGPLRSFYSLELLSPAEFAVTLAIFAAWAIVLQGIWRLRVGERLDKVIRLDHLRE